MLPITSFNEDLLNHKMNVTEQKLIESDSNNLQLYNIDRKLIKNINTIRQFHKQPKQMKDFQSDKKLKQIDQQCIEFARQSQENTNADIEYLLSYINVNEEEQLNMVQNGEKQKRALQILSCRQVEKYIRKNSSHESQSSEERAGLVSLIDSGMRLISRIRSVMQRKKYHNNKKNQNNKLNQSQPSPTQFLKDLFFPKIQTESPSKSNNQLSNGTQYTTDNKMKQFRLERQLQMLLARVNTSKKDSQKDLQNSKRRDYKYLITVSIHEQLESSSTSSNNPKTQQQFLILLDKLQHTLAKLEDLKKQKNTHQDKKLYQPVLNEAWTYIEDLSDIISKDL